MNGPFGVKRCFGDAKPSGLNEGKGIPQKNVPVILVLTVVTHIPKLSSSCYLPIVSLANLWLFVPYTRTALLNLVGFCLCNPRKVTLFSRGPKFCLCLVCIWYGALDMP